MALERQVERPRHFPLLDRCGLEACAQDRAAGLETLHTLDLQRRPDIAALQWVVAHGMADIAHQLDRVVDLHVVRDRHPEDRIAELPGVVLDALDFAERDGVHDAVDIAQAHGTDGQALHCTEVAADIHVVVDGQGVFDDDEQTGDQVRHQRLRTKTDGQTDHTGTGQQWRDVHAHVRQGDDGGDDKDGHEQHVADQRHHGLRTRIGQAFARAGQGMVDCGVAEDPDQPGKQQRAGQAEQLDADFMAVAFGKANQRQAPHAQAQFDKHQPHHQVGQGVDKAFQALGIQRVALVPALWLEGVAAHQAVDHHAQHQQHRAQQRLAQGGAAVAGRQEGGEQRDTDQQQGWQVPEGADN